ncbi:non-ribosomal peptide synthetase, partial [Methylosinus sp. Sm6]|uniref:non-ribosomal peptide synthetase n=1 Tax=Methylosinus sp. Sm6 TaxID=2866948 RepID=UPI001C9A1A71
NVAHPANLAYVIYTSGSTGRPKGVAVTHGGVVNRLAWMQAEYRLTPSDVVLQKTPFGFDVSVWEFFLPLVAGARLVLLPPGDHRDPSRLSEAITKSGVTILHFVPSMLQTFLSVDDLPTLATVRCVVCSGEALPTNVKNRFYVQQSAKLHNLYGPTEASIDITAFACDSLTDNASIPIGRPIWNTQVYLLDASFEPIPIGACGELFVGGAGLARGYLRRADLTAERFTPNPFAEGGARLYRTGDLCRYRADGNLEFLGRLDDQVKIRGFRIELGEIEAELTRIASVREAVVVAREDGVGEKRLVAYVTARAGMTLSSRDLRAALLSSLPDYMVPSAFVTLDALPLSPNGKIDRKALPAPDADITEVAGLVAPRTATEAALCAIWAEALGLERVGVVDNFFELGGDSLSSVRAVGLAKARGLKFSLEAVYRGATIAMLAQQLDRDASDGCGAEQIPPFSLLSVEDRALLPKDVVDAYPLTALQAGMIFHSGLGDNSYHMVDSLTVKCAFDFGAFRCALDDVLRMHPVLRTYFDLRRFSEPLQLVRDAVAAPFAYTDLRSLSDRERADELERWIESQEEERFELSEAPLCRFQAHLLTEDVFQFTFSHHHVILDGWSVNVLLVDIVRRYVGYLQGRPEAHVASSASLLPQLVGLERAALRSDESRAFWEQRIGSRERSSSRTRGDVGRASDAARQAVATEKRTLPSEVTTLLHALAAETHVPVKSILLTAHLEVLGLLQAQSEVITGLVCGIRPEEPDADRCLGLFLNTLPIRYRTTSGTWRDAILDVFSEEIALLQRRFYPVAALQSEKGGEPLFDSVFNYLNYHVVKEARALSDVEVLGWRERASALTGMLVAFQQHTDSPDITMSISVDRLRFGPTSTTVIAKLLVTTIAAMVNDPDGRRESLAFLAEDDLRRIAMEPARSTYNIERELSLHQMFDEQALRTPAAIAVTYAGSDLTYRELRERSDRSASRLRKLGAGPEHRIGLMFESAIDMAIAIFAVMKAGGAFIPLDPNYPEEVVKYIVADSHVAILLTTSAGAERFSACSASTICLDADDDSLLPEPWTEPEPLPSDLRQAAYVIYTSGSTGVPKGVVVEHRNILHSTLARFERYPDPVRSCVLLPSFNFDCALGALFWTLTRGGRLCRPSRDEAVRLGAIADLIQSCEASHLISVPALYPSLLSEEFREKLSSLSSVIVGGETCPPSLTVAHLKLLPRVKLYNEYGPTECSVWSTVAEIEEAVEAGLVSIGRPIAGVRALVLDGRGRALPPGVPGELHIGGPSVARGYLGRADLTAERFTPDSFGGAGDRLYRTGDICRFREDGCIDFLGRLDDQVKIRGFRIELGEIEAALSLVPQVRHAAVVALEDSRQERRLVAYVSAREGATLAASELRTMLRTRLPDHMIPTVFVILDVLPLTANGKIDRKALPEPGMLERERPGRLPRTMTEKAVAAVVAETLSCDVIYIDSNFFDLGGTSLHLIRLMARLETAVGVVVPLKSVYECVDLAELAELIDLTAALARMSAATSSSEISDVEEFEICAPQS